MDGAETFLFGGSTIQENTVLLAETGELSDNAGAGLGVGYDLVLDCNRNEILDAGDYIDGRGEQAGFYLVRDTTLPGPLPVVEIDYSVGVF